MGALLQDIRFGIRMLAQRPGFTALAVIALALGIGVNTAIFSVVNAVLLRPLPYERPDELVMVWNNLTRQNLERIWISVPEINDYRNLNSSFTEVAALNDTSHTLTTEDEPAQIDGITASANLFSLLGTQPLIGRAFSPEEEQPGRERVAVISHGLWQRLYGAAPEIDGKEITLDGRRHAVIGVMPPEFQFPPPNVMRGAATMRAEVWTPLVPDPDELNERGSRSYHLIGRLKPGVTLEQAQADMSGVAATLQRQYPEQYSTESGWSITVVPLHEQVTGGVRAALLVLLAAVGFVLLIACANVANLLLVRATARRKEVAIRTALGASRMRLVRQFLTESLLLALAGGAVGLLLAWWGTDVLVSLTPAEIPRVKEVAIDQRVLGWTALVAVVTGFVFGLAPALQTSKLDLNATLKEGSRGLSGDGKHQRMRSLLVVSEVALSLMLLIGAGLLIKSFLRLQEVDPGFDPEDVVTMRLTLPEQKYPEPQQRAAFYEEVLERAGALPGVEAVGGISHLPLSGANSDRSFMIEGVADDLLRTTPPNAQFRRTTTDYFAAMSIPLVEGRYFNQRDTEKSPLAVIINQTLARRYFGPEGRAVGRRIGWNHPIEWREVVGVVGDVRHFGLDAKVEPEMYVPHTQMPGRSLTLVARTAATAGASAQQAALREAVIRVDKDQPVYDVKTMEQVFAASIAQRRLSMLLLGIFSAVALVLAAIGLYGVMAYTVTQRTHEIGVRMALGAQTRDVLRLVVGQGMTLVVAGLGLGLVAAFALTRVMSSLLYGVSATDPVTFAGVSLLLAAVALFASYIPARRATRVDPIQALRYE